MIMIFFLVAKWSLADFAFALRRIPYKHRKKKKNHPVEKQAELLVDSRSIIQCIAPISRFTVLPTSRPSFLPGPFSVPSWAEHGRCCVGGNDYCPSTSEICDDSACLYLIYHCRHPSTPTRWSSPPRTLVLCRSSAQCSALANWRKKAPLVVQPAAHADLRRACNRRVSQPTLVFDPRRVNGDM